MDRKERRSRAGGALSQAATEFIRAHSAEKFSLEALSAALYVNGSYLARVFKAQTGMTLLEFHNRTRCEQAARLLSENELDILRVGESVGFVSSSHFSHVFKKITGQTPSEYRRAHADPSTR